MFSVLLKATTDKELYQELFMAKNKEDVVKAFAHIAIKIQIVREWKLLLFTQSLYGYSIIHSFHFIIHFVHISIPSFILFNLPSSLSKHALIMASPK